MPETKAAVDLFQVCWKTSTGHTIRGIAEPKFRAEEWAEQCNKQWPHLYHWVEPEDQNADPS